LYVFKNVIENLSFVLNYQEEGGAVPGQPVRDDGGECVLPGLPAGLPTRGQEGEAAYASVHQVFLYICFGNFTSGLSQHLRVFNAHSQVY